jgi:hypothetical protein
MIKLEVFEIYNKNIHIDFSIVFLVLVFGGCYGEAFAIIWKDLSV